MDFVRRDIFLKIEKIKDYSPLAPLICARHYGRDCMLNEGHEFGRIPRDEILNSRVDAVVYREYIDPNYTIPNKVKLIKSDVNEPQWDRRVPGTVLYAKPGERLYIHVLNGDTECHSFHLHGLKYGIDSDGAWPFGVSGKDGSRSDEILPNQRWTYVFDITFETIGAWVFHDHVRNIERNVNRGLFGGLVVRDPFAPCVDHEIPIFIHQMEGEKQDQFNSDTLSQGQTFEHTFLTPGTYSYYCQIHGEEVMNGQVEVVPGIPFNPGNPPTVTMKDIKFHPQTITVASGGVVRWVNQEVAKHIVFFPGKGASNFCLNGRAYVGNTPTIEANSGERLRWYLFNMDLGTGVHNFHPHSARWQLPVPPNGASDVHSLSPAESFIITTEVPTTIRLPHILKELQHDPPKDACRVRLKGEFLFHCHIEEHMMRGLAGLLRARQYVWITEDVAKRLPIELPYDDESNECTFIDLTRCQTKKNPISGPSNLHETGMLKNEAHIDLSGMEMPGTNVQEAVTKGVWELLPCDSQVLAVHAALLHTGKVLFIAGSGNDETNRNEYRSVVWDYKNGTFKYLTTPTDIFCAGHSFLSDGRLLVAGGTKEYDIQGHGFYGEKSTYIFDPTLEEFIRVSDMTDGRWYPTLVTLGDSRILTVSGLSENGSLNIRPEFYSSLYNWNLMKNTMRFPLYSHLFLLGDGRLFYSGGHLGGSEGIYPGWLNLTSSKFSPMSTGLPLDFDLEHRDQCASVLLPPAQLQRVMIIGGGDPAINKVHIIDLLEQNPSYTPAAPLHYARMHLNAVILPNRTVFVCGGNANGEDVSTQVTEAEIYDPSTNTWTVVAKATVPRLYHSVALLLPDGRVITAGSNPNRRDNELRLELFHPPYLFKGPRPIIESAPKSLAYGEVIEIHTPQAKNIKWVHLIKPMATTHSMDSEQRLVDLPFKNLGFCKIRASIPNEPNLAPPGWYMLFIVNQSGIPSIAKWIHLK